MANIPLNPSIIDDFSGGVLRKVSMHKMPQNAVPHALNFVFDEILGEALLRKGTAMVGAQIVDNKAVLGLANLRRRADTNHALLAVVSDGSHNDIYKATTWAKSLQDDTKDLKTRFAQFLDSIIRLNGTDGAKSFNGTTWITTAGVFDLANVPASTKYPMNFKDRVHAIGDDGILYSSSIPFFFLDYDAQSANFTVNARVTGGTSGATGIIYADNDSGATGTLLLIGVTGTFKNDETITDDATGAGSATANGVGGYQISWTRGGISGYITTPIDPDNGEKGKCMGLGKVGGLMVIFFERGMYSWNGSSTEADLLVGIGCSSNESIALDRNSGLLFFANEYGIYATRGGYPQKISKFVDEFFKNMSTSNYQHIAGGCDGEHYFCSIGDVTINNVTYSNVVLRYTIQSQEWIVLSYPTQPRVFSQYLDGTTVKMVYGDDDGNVIQIDSTDENDNYASTTDAPIEYELETRDIFEPLKGMNKTVAERIVINSRQSSGAKVLLRKNSNIEADWKNIGEIKKETQELEKIPFSDYKWLRLRITGRSTKGRLAIESIEIPNKKLNGY